MFKKAMAMLTLAVMMVMESICFPQEAHAAAMYEPRENGEWDAWATPGVVADVLEDEEIVDLLDVDCISIFQGNVVRVAWVDGETFVSQDESILTVKGGILKGAAVGQTSVKVALGETEKVVKVMVLPWKTFSSGSSAEVSLDGGDLEVVVRGVGNELLEEGVDYQLTVDDSHLPEYYEFDVRGINDYQASSWSGRRNVPEGAFYESEDIVNATIRTQCLDSIKYTGDAVEPWIEVSMNGDELVRGEDYEISYVDNVHVGEAVICIDGISDYTGHREIAFAIIPGENSLKVNKSSVTLKGTKQSVKLAASDRFGAKVSYKSSNKNVVVSKDGKVKAKKKGNYKATITITAKGCRDYETKTRKVKVVVKK